MLLVGTPSRLGYDSASAGITRFDRSDWSRSDLLCFDDDDIIPVGALTELQEDHCQTHILEIMHVIYKM